MRGKQMRGVQAWNLTLVATSVQTPGAMVDALANAVRAQGCWVLRQDGVSDRCAEMEFEFPRGHGIEVYGLLVGLGLELSRDGHTQLMGLCHCTGHAEGEALAAVARAYLTVYGREGSEGFLGEVFAGFGEAA